MRRRTLYVLSVCSVSTVVVLVIAFQGKWTSTATSVPNNIDKKPIQTSKTRFGERFNEDGGGQEGHSQHRLPAGEVEARPTNLGLEEPAKKKCDEVQTSKCFKDKDLAIVENVNDKKLGGEETSEWTTMPQSGHKGGYMLSFRYYEQQTQGTRNLLQMQCLAHSVGMRIVEPFVIRSMFSIPISNVSSTEKLSQTYLTLNDLVDMKRWNLEAAKKFGYTSIASWEEFLHKAPRKVVANCIRYRNPPKIPVPIPGFNFREGCPDSCFDRFRKSMEYLGAFSFQLVKSTCSNFVDYAGSVTKESFFENALGTYSPNEVTLLVNEFRGFFGLYRLPINSECGILHNRVNLSTLPSTRIKADAQKYATDVFQGRTYAAVVVRIERIILHLHLNVSNCSQEIVRVLQSLKTSHGISDTFLAMDVGKFGSSGSVRHNFQPYGEVIFNSIYGNQWSFNKWEESFENSSSSSNPAYVANLQRTIAASGSCLILVGGGGFQGQARNLYEKLHPDTKSWCLYKICSR